jgi:hypothetical protein
MDIDRAALDRYITGGRYNKYEAEAFCHNAECSTRNEPIEIEVEEEYGAAWWTPEECPTCGEELHEERAE